MSTTINQQLSDSYNETPYHSHPFPQTAPEHLAAIATLFGVQAVPVERARILELGCASGGNLIPTALRLPHAHITGVDLSSVQIAEGQATIARLGLNNISLHHMDLSAITPDFGTFDYIIAHGVYSWVPQEVQVAMLRICGENLSDQGLAYISYNTYPGWKYREVIRDAMMFRGAGRSTPQEKLSYARGMIDFLHDKSNPDSLTRKNIDDVLPLLKSSENYYLIHEFLEHCNFPCYFHELIERAQQHGLYYLAESQPSTMFLSNFSTDIIEPLLRECHGNQVAVEQHLDFLTGRSFRQTILLKQDRATEINYQLNTVQLQQLHYAGIFAPKQNINDTHESEYFSTLYGLEVHLSHPIAIMTAQVLNADYPSTLQINEIAERVSQRSHQTGNAQTIEECLPVIIQFIKKMITQGVLRCRSSAVLLATEVAEYPVRDALACNTATANNLLTNAWHETVALNVIEQSIWPLLDGQHNQAQLHAHLLQEVAANRLSFSQQGELLTDADDISTSAHEHLNANLTRLQRNGLLQRSVTSN